MECGRQAHDAAFQGRRSTDVAELVAFLRSYSTGHPGASKHEVERATVEAFELRKSGAAYVGGSFSVRFSSAEGPSFSNTVCGLRRLEGLDSRPFVVAVVRPDGIELLLANSTFLKRVSHSSQGLRMDSVRGSFNGTDIVRSHSGTCNSPENFDELFAIHEEFTWEENLERLVEATNNIAPRGRRFSPNADEVRAILKSPDVAAALAANSEYERAKQALAHVASERSAEILDLARIDNVNVRGNLIEQVITGGVNTHGLGDVIRQAGGTDLHVEIKTKLVDRTSSPKGYNVDKALEVLAGGNAVVSYCFVGLDLKRGSVTASTVSIFDPTVLNATRIQFHWAGRNSRGVTQLTGDLAPLFSPDYSETIDVMQAQRFLNELIDL